jgi:signal transduction histidine kinase/CheY-like chemotaxis protein
MLGGSYRRGIGYPLAVCITALVLLGREAVAGFLGRSDPFLPFIGAVLVASWEGGLRPGLLATLLSAVATDFFLVPPFYSLQIGKIGHRGDLLLFVVIGVLISSLSEKRLRLVRQLQRADRSKDEFLATLAHELRNPLAPISNSVEYLRLNPSPDPHARRLCEIIKRQVDQLTRLVEDLLDISRITRGKLELRRESIELAQVVESAVETARPSIDTQGHELSVRLPPERIVLDADPIRLAQVFSNLLNNAAKFTPPGGGIQLVAERYGADVVVAVRDNGIGILADDLPRIFEIFAQVGRATRASMSGVGIGLAHSKRLVEMHGGTIGAASDGLGEGSEFKVRLPVAAATAGIKSKGPSREQKRIPLMDCCVLVADDNKDSVETLSVLLAASGCQVHTAYDGLQAAELAQKIRPDVVLLDIDMPVLDGYGAARRIRGRECGHHITLIALTGWAQEDDVRRSTEAGFDYHLTKPLNLTRLRALLEKLRQPASLTDPTRPSHSSN